MDESQVSSIRLFHLMTRVISMLNLQQGGGKTTTTVNLAAALAYQGAQVLVVEMDPSSCLQNRIRTLQADLIGNGGTNLYLIRTPDDWDLLPAAACASLLHARTVSRALDAGMGDDQMPELFETYDYVLIDTCMHEGSLLFEALVLTDEIVVPLDSESLQFYDAVERLGQLFSKRNAINPRMKFAGVFFARYSPRVRRAREMLSALYDALGPVHCYSAYLPESSEIRQAEKRRASVVSDAPNSRGAKTFHQLAEQIATAPALRNTAEPILLELPGRSIISQRLGTTESLYVPAANISNQAVSNSVQWNGSN